MKKRVLTGLLTSMVAFTVFGGAVLTSKKSDVYVPTFATYENGDADTYYNGIKDSLTGDDLLAALRSLNKNKRSSTVGYNAMGTTPSGQFKYTDYDPSTVQYDSNGQPYGTRLISFYSGNSAVSGMNREHVWPNSHGGNLVEKDIHMPRPTIEKENGSRGNSFYVEGMKDGSKGWDPAMESFGEESYRGDSARIIFYCVVADSDLSLIDDTYHATSKNNRDNLMGKLSDMLSWNLRYPVQQREQNRNEGAEYLQGNRNPFIDHPEYACRIWGNYNSATQQVCSSYVTKTVAIYNGGAKASDTNIEIGNSLIFDGYVDGSQNSAVTWSLESTSGSQYMDDAISLSVSNGRATVTANSEGSAYLKASYTYLANSQNNVATARIKISAVAPSVLDSISVTNPKTKYYVGDTFVKPTVTAHYTGGSSVIVTSSAEFSGYNLNEAGNYTVTVSYEGKETSYTITVSAVEPSSIEVSNIKSKYDLNDEFVKPTVTCIMNNGDRVDVTEQAVFTGFDSSTTGTKPITVTYLNFSDTFSITVVDEDNPEVVSISLTNIKTTYRVGDEFVKPTVTALFDNGEEEDVTDEAEFSGFRSDIEIDASISVRYGGLTEIYDYKVISADAPIVERIYVVNPKTDYHVGESFVAPKVMAVYSDGSEEDVSEYASFSGFLNHVVGTQTINVMYEGVSVTYVITVESKELSKITITKLPNKTEYTVGEQLDLTGLTVVATYRGGLQETLTSEQYTVSDVDMSKEGTATVTISYTFSEVSKTDSFKVTISGGSMPKLNGCGGDIIVTSVILSSLALIGIGLIIGSKIYRKKKYE